MRLHHHDSQGDCGTARAHGLGERFAGAIAGNVARYRTHFRLLGIPDSTVAEVATGSWEALRDWAPHLADEVEALAAGADLPVLDVVALNARTEVLATAAPIDECSTVVRLPRPGDGPAVTFQTWDWHPHLAPVGLLWTYRTDAGRRVRSFTELGMLTKIGLNDAGLALNFNILHHRSDSGIGGVPVHAVARRILDESGSLREATDLARSAPVSASTVLTVLAASEAASIELAPDGVGLVSPDAAGVLVHTNHFLDPTLATNGLVSPHSTTTARWRLLADTAAAADTSSHAALTAGLCGTAESASPLLVRPDPRLPAHQRVQTLLSVRMVPDLDEFDCVAGSTWATQHNNTLTSIHMAGSHEGRERSSG